MKRIFTSILIFAAVIVSVSCFNAKTVKADPLDGYLTLDECTIIVNNSNNELNDAKRKHEEAYQRLLWAKEYGSREELDQAISDDNFWDNMVRTKTNKYNIAVDIYYTVSRMQNDLNFLYLIRDKLNNMKMIRNAELEVTNANQVVVDKQTIYMTYSQCADQAQANANLNPGLQPIADQAKVTAQGAANDVAVAQAVVAQKQANVDHLKATLPLPSNQELMQLAQVKRDFEPVMARLSTIEHQ